MFLTTGSLPRLAGAEPSSEAPGPGCECLGHGLSHLGPVSFLVVCAWVMDNEGVARGGEYLVAHALEACGVRVVRVDLSGHDLWCRTVSGRLVSVQVKTCGSARFDRDRSALRYEFYDRGGSMRPDVFAFVALDLGLMLFLAGMGRRKNIRAVEFTGDAMRESIARFFY